MITFKQFISEGIEDRGIFKAIFILGSPGAGKSYSVKKLTGQIQPVIINTDKAVEFIAKRDGTKAESETWSLFRDSALRITKNQLEQYLNGMLPLFVDGTSNNTSNILHRIGILESLGYDVGIVHVTADWDLIKARIEQRNSKTNRKVDIAFAEKVFKQAPENIAFLKGKVSFFKEFRNGHEVMDNSELDEIFKEVQKFFSGPVVNPVGKRNIEKLKAEKQKYMVPTIVSQEALNNKTDGWYRE